MAAHPNVSIVTSPFEAPDLPKNYADWVILNDNYHDTYWENDEASRCRAWIPTPS